MTAFLDSCFSFHPNASTGVGGDRSGYLLTFSQASDDESKATSWEVYIHQDLKWASMHLAASYTRLRIAPGTYNQVVLSSKEVHQMDTEFYPCEARLNYSQDQVRTTYTFSKGDYNEMLVNKNKSQQSEKRDEINILIGQKPHCTHICIYEERAVRSSEFLSSIYIYAVAMD